MPEEYRYRASVKSSLSDELVNTYLLRPIASLFVRALYKTPVTPNQVTGAAVLAGFTAAIFYSQGTREAIVAAGLFITLKDLLDSADGQLARAKSLYSRAGRFLDSIGDVLVSLLVFSAIGWTLYRSTGDWLMPVLSGIGFIGITLRVSYHVFYQSSYLHLEGKYEKNRIIEEITEEDMRGDRATLNLQRAFIVIYGWQDRLMLRIDEWCRRGHLDEDFRQRWYGDALGLRLSGLLGFGTELLLLTLCSVMNGLEMYLYLNAGLMNLLLISSILYRRMFLMKRISTCGGISGAGDNA